jgi:hypothetical protein
MLRWHAAGGSDPHVVKRAAGATMFRRLCLLYHVVALVLCAAAIVALVAGVVGWLVFVTWMILAAALYVGGWVYYLVVMSEPPTWDIDFEL